MTRGAAIGAKPCWYPRSRELQREIRATGQAAVNGNLRRDVLGHRLRARFLLRHSQFILEVKLFLRSLFSGYQRLYTSAVQSKPSGAAILACM